MLAGMIRAFQSAYGNDRRGRAKKAEIKISYDAYHNYISVMQEEVDRLDPYQQALIKNFHSYDDTRLYRFIPTLALRENLYIYGYAVHLQYANKRKLHDNNRLI